MAGNPFDDLIPRPGSVQNAPNETDAALDVTPGTTIVPGTAERYPDIPSSVGLSARQPMPGTLVFGDDIKPPTPALPTPGGWTDPQQYAELAKGVIPGAIKSAGTVLQAPDVLVAKGQQGAASFGKNQLDVMDRIDRGERVRGIDDALGYQDMSPEQKATARARLQQAQQAFSPTPIQDRTFFKAGEGVQNYAKTVLPAAPGYENAFLRRVGEGGGSLAFGIPIAAIFGPVASGITFSAMGVGEAAQRAVDYDRKERAVGRTGLTQDQIATAGLLGVGPGATGVLPVEVLLNRLPIRIPEVLRRPLAQGIARIGTQAVIEGVQEGGQGFLQDLIAREVYNPNQVLGENFRSDAEVGGAVGGLAEIFRQMGAGVIRSAAGRRGPSAGQSQPTPEAPNRPQERQEPQLPWPVTQNVETPPAVTPADPAAAERAPRAPRGRKKAAEAAPATATANPFADLVPSNENQQRPEWVSTLADAIGPDQQPAPTGQPTGQAPQETLPSDKAIVSPLETGQASITLYRGEAPGAENDPMRPARSGQNWTDTLENAQAYAGEGGKVFAVTVPAGRAGELQRSTVREDEVRIPADLQDRSQWQQVPAQAVKQPDARAPAQAPVPAPAAVQPMRVVTPDGSMEIEAVPEVVELADLKRAEGALQPRDRSRSEYAQETRERAANLDPQRLQPSRTSDTGAPIVASDGTVLSGNGRTMSIEQAYRDRELAGVADTYRRSLGPAAEGMREPVLVMRAARLSPQEATRFADLSNRTGIAQMSATERALRDAQAMGLDGIALYEGGNFDAPQNQRFMRDFMTRAVTAAEMPSVSREGQLTLEGVARMRAAVLAAAYGDADVLSRMLESTDDNVRSITAGLLDAAPRMAQLRAGIASGEVDPDMDPVPALMDAVRTISDLRSRKVSVQQWLAQSDAFGRDPIMEAWVKSFYYDDSNRAKRQEKVALLLNDYAAEAVLHRPGGLFADETTTADVLNVARRKNDASEADVAPTTGPMGEAVPKGRASKGRRPDGASGQRTAEGDDILAAIQSAPPRIEYEARAILKDARDYEDHLVAEGANPQQIATAFNARYGSAVTPDQIESGNVWWRRMPGEREVNYDSPLSNEYGILTPGAASELVEQILSDSPLVEGVAAPMDVDARPTAPQQTKGVSGGASPGPRLSADQRNTAVALAQQGMNSRQIASEMQKQSGAYVRSDLVDAAIAAAKATSDKARSAERSAANRRAYYNSSEFREASSARMREMMARPEMQAWARERGRQLAASKGQTVWTPAMTARLGQPDVRAMTAQQVAASFKDEFGKSASALTANAVRKKRSSLGYADTVAGKSPFTPEMENRLADPDIRSLQAAPALAKLKAEFGVDATSRLTPSTITNKRAGNPDIAYTGKTTNPTGFQWAPRDDGRDPSVRLAQLMTEASNPTERAAILNKEFGGPGILTISPKAVQKRWDKIKDSVLRSQGEEPMFAAGGWDARSWLDWIKGKPDVDAAGTSQAGRPQPQAGRSLAGQQSGTDRTGSQGNEAPANGAAVGISGTFRLRGLAGRILDGPPNPQGLRQGFVFLHPDKAWKPDATLDSVTLKVFQQVPNWTAKAHVSETEPGVWALEGIAVRKNKQRGGLGSELLDVIEREIGLISAPQVMSPSLYGMWKKREAGGASNVTTSVDDYVAYRKKFYSPEMIREQLDAANEMAAFSDSTIQQNIWRKKAAELSDLVDKLPPEDDILAAIQGDPSQEASADLMAAVNATPPARNPRVTALQFVTKMKRPVTLPERVVSGVHDALQPFMGMVPPDTAVGVLTKIEPFKGKGNANALMVFAEPDGSLFDVPVVLADVIGNRAIMIPDLGAIGFLRFDLASDLGSGLRGELGHELVHVLRRQNNFAAAAWSRLVAQGNALGVLDSDYRTYLQQIGNAHYNTIPAGKTGRDLYEFAYRSSPTAVLRERLDQETVAHMLELYVAGQLFDPKMWADPGVAPILDAILDGSIWKIPQEGEVQQGELELMGASQGSQSPANMELQREKAEAEGFNTDVHYWHGTGRDLTETGFDLRKAQDKEGRRRGVGLGKGKVYLDANREGGNSWAMAAKDRGLGDNPNVVGPLWVRGPLIDENDYKAEFERISGGRPITDSTLDMAERDRLIAATDKAVKAQGYKGIQTVYHNRDGSVAELGQTAIFSTSDIRHVNADFDPDRSGSSDLMAAAQKAAQESGATPIGSLTADSPHPGPILAYHGTMVDLDGGRFDPDRGEGFGVHFGTQEQANKIAAERHGDEPVGYYRPYKGPSRVIPAVLDVYDPITLPDLGHWPPKKFAAEIERARPDIGGVSDAVARTMESTPGNAEDKGRAAYHTIRDHLTRSGIDSIRYRNKKEGDGWSYIVWEPGTVSSPISNDTLFAAQKGKTRLAALHNVSAENLAFADKLGGIAAPSVAVVKEGMGVGEGFGEITLIGRKDLGDPGRNPVYDADAWSIRFPRPDYKAVPTAKAQKFVDAMRPYAAKFDDTGSMHEAWDYMVNDVQPQRNVSQLLRSEAAQAMFLDRVKGKTIEPVMRPALSSATYPWVDTAAFRAFLSSAPADWYHSEPQNEAAIKTALGQAISDAIDEYTSSKKMTSDGRALDADDRAHFRDLNRDQGLTDDNQPAMDRYRLNQDVEKIGKKSVDSGETRKRLERAIKPYEAEFKTWVDNQIVPMHGEPRIKVNGRLEPYTLENITRVMTAPRSVQAQEDHMTFGEGKARAAAAKKIDSLEEARNRSEWQMGTKAEIEEAREHAKKLMDEWRTAVVPYNKYVRANSGQSGAFGSTFEALDGSMRAMATAAKRGGIRADALRSALSREDFVGVPADVLELGVEAGKAFMSAPVPYFESKPQRSVKLNEFAGAVIPKKASAETKAILDKHGIPYQTYDSNKEGAKDKAAAKFTQDLARQGQDTLFAIQRNRLRDQDSLGYYSQALEAARALKQAKGTPEQMLAQLKSAGVKQAEIDATNLAQFLNGKKSVTRDDIVGHLEGARVGLQERSTGRTAEQSAVAKELQEWRDDEMARLAEPDVGRDGGVGAIDDFLPSRNRDRRLAEIEAWAKRNGSQFSAEGFDDGDAGGLTAQPVQIGIWSEIESHLLLTAPNGKSYLLGGQGYREEGDAATLLRDLQSEAEGQATESINEAEEDQRERIVSRLEDRDPTKWSSYSLDPSNPTYRETVIHLPATTGSGMTAVPHPDGMGFAVQKADGSYLMNGSDPARWSAQRGAELAIQQQSRGAVSTLSDFQSGHFSEPNIIGHMMTSMTTHEGRPVFLIDQIQSDWGQKLRDGGVRDEGKIAELERLYREANAKVLAMEADRLPTLSTNGAEALTKQKFGDAATWAKISNEQREDVAKLSAENTAKNTELNRRMDAAGADSDRLEAEWNSARNSASGNPLVNTTDQWVNTTLRRAIRQAAEADAAYIAIPSGDTVLSYNPGDNDGMEGFYGAMPNPRGAASLRKEIADVEAGRNTNLNLDYLKKRLAIAENGMTGIVPKNLRNILTKLDKASPAPQRIETLDSPSGKTGLGHGFTLFPLTDRVKQEVLDEGQPLFAFGGVQSPDANISAYTEAVVMNRRGASAQEILDATGWYKDKSGKWKFWNEGDPVEPQTVAESRSHVRRMEMTPEERRATPPWMEQPATEDIFANTKRIYSHAKDVVRAELSKTSPRLTATKNGVTAVLTRSVDGSGGFRITSFRDGEPIGHRDYKADDQGINLAAQDMVSHGLRPSGDVPAPSKPAQRASGGSVSVDRSFIDRALNLARRARKH